MSIKDEARPTKTNQNNTVSILDAYYNNIYTNLNLPKKKFIRKRALYRSVSKK